MPSVEYTKLLLTLKDKQIKLRVLKKHLKAKSRKGDIGDLPDRISTEVEGIEKIEKSLVNLRRMKKISSKKLNKKMDSIQKENSKTRLDEISKTNKTSGFDRRSLKPFQGGSPGLGKNK